MALIFAYKIENNENLTNTTLEAHAVIQDKNIICTTIIAIVGASNCV